MLSFSIESAAADSSTATTTTPPTTTTSWSIHRQQVLIVSKIYTNTWFIVPHHHLVGSHIVFRKRSNKERLGETVREEEMKENIKLFTAIFSPLRLLFPTPHKPHAWMLDTCLDLYLFNFRILLRPLPPHSNIIHRLSRFHLYFLYLHSYWTQIAILWIRRAHTADIVTATERGYMWIHCEWKYFAVHILFSPHTIWNCGRRRRAMLLMLFGIF